MDAPVRPSDLIEGDYIETVEGLLFTVKGLFHPEGHVIAYLRYVPDARGDRGRGGERYRRVYDIVETTDFLQRRHPQYVNRVESLGQTLQTVPRSRIAKVHRPREGLRSLMACSRTELERTVERFVSALSSESGVPTEMLGVSGSILIGLTSPSSDIDLIAYGGEAGWKVYNALRRLRETQEWISPHDARTVEGVVKARWGDTELDLERLTEIEIGKALHGQVCDVDYFVRLVKWPGEVEAEIASRPLCRVKLRAVVVEARDSIFTPCTYKVRDGVFIDAPCHREVSEFVSFRGKFTEQVKEGDVVEARGTLEEVEYGDRTIHRVMLGGRGDHLVPI